jgi:hypothetical protein
MNIKNIKFFGLFLIILDIFIYFINRDLSIARFLTVIGLILIFKDDFKTKNNYKN